MNKGNVLVEFAICLIVLMLFIWGLIGLGLWGLGAEYTKEAAGLAALDYARMRDVQSARQQVQKTLNAGGYLVLEPTYTLNIQENIPTVTVTLTTYTKDKLKRLFVFQKDSFTYTAKATFERYYRNPGEFNN